MELELDYSGTRAALEGQRGCEKSVRSGGRRPARIARFALLFSAGAMALMPAIAQERSQSGSREGSTQVIRPGERKASSILVEPSEDYQIGPRDVLEIAIEDAPELSGVVEVNSKGTIPMRYLRVVSVLGKTPEEVARHIAEALRGKYLRDPQVSVTVREHNSRIFFVQGSVRNPGVYQMEGRASLFKLITLAGGFQDNHGSTAYIIRRQDESEQPAPAKTEPASEAPAQDTEQFQMTPVNIAGLENGHFDQNVLLRPGDLVVIPKTDLFFVSGEVVQPGEYSLKPNTTVRQAITLARGFTFKAAKGRAIIFRDDRKTGERQQITVDLGAIMDGKKEDILLMANDVLQVPSSRAKSIGGTLLNAFGMSTAMRGVPVR